jgi:diguanylate cyclase (GGDEF)-like protein
MKRNKSAHISIPVKIVFVTALSYVALWGGQTALATYGAVDFSGSVFGIGFWNVYLAFEIVVVALVATISTHMFLDKPLKTLMAAMGKAREGDFLVRAPVAANDEIGALSDAFNRMLSRLTDLSANKIQADQDLMMVQEQLKLKSDLEEKTSIIERTNKTLEHLVKDLSLIYEIGQEVSSIVDLEDLYSHITETLKRYLRIDDFAILVFDDKMEELHIKVAHGFDDREDIMNTTFRLGEGITGLAAQTGKKIYIKDTSREARFLHYKGEKPKSASSFLSIPLLYKEEVLGVINFSRKGISTFTYQDVKMLSLVANQVALAIANARLYTKTRELSVKDELIGIHNRRYFHQMLQMEWKRAVRFRRSLSMIMVDVDHFKEYNDTFGHLQGDQVLKKTGQMMRKNLREVDTVARFGGEEFVLLLPDTDKRGAIAVAEKVRMLIEGHAFVSDEQKATRMVTISAGISTYPDDVEQMDDLIDHADIALYRAKENGRNRVECYTLPDDDLKVRGEAEVGKEEILDEDGSEPHLDS